MWITFGKTPQSYQQVDMCIAMHFQGLIPLSTVPTTTTTNYVPSTSLDFKGEHRKHENQIHKRQS